MKRWQIAVTMAAFGVVGVGCEAERSAPPAPKSGPSGAGRTGPVKVRRFGSVIGLKEEKIPYYKELHAACWPGVLKNITDCNIRNYSIYMRKMDDGKHYLFGYFEYTGDDLAADMKKMAADPIVKKWWKETDPCQFGLENRKEGEWWAPMEEVFHCD